MNFKISAYALQDMGSRNNQEDCFFPPFLDPCHFDETQRDWSFYDGTPHTDDRLFIVCDGMGGHDRGEVASRIVASTMGSALLQSAPIEGLFSDDILQDAVHKSYEALLSEYDPNEERKMGTTMALLKFHADGATVCHIGDSRVYQFRPKEGMVFRTTDHSHGHMLLRCMMAKKDYEPQVEINHLTDIQKDDIFLLCSDGIYEKLNDEDITALFCNPNYSDVQLTQQLLRQSIDNRDNHTAIIVRVQDVFNNTNTAIGTARVHDIHTETLRPGTVLNGKNYSYHVEKVLGHGAFGITYLVNTNVTLQGQLGTVHTGVKLCMKEFFMHNGMKRVGNAVEVISTDDKMQIYAGKFQREARQLARLSHPNIVKVLEVFEANGTYYYTMEYLPGGSLLEYVKGKDGLPEQEALGYIRQIGFALQYLHTNKLLHLDIKPGNVMRDTATGMVKVIDFGLAKHYEDDGQAMSSALLGAGTSGYAPLEQISSSEEQAFSPQLDIYALGATYYKLLTSLTPNSAIDVLNSGLNTVPLVKRNVSNKSIKAIKAAMKPQTKDRLKTVQEFLDMLPSVDDESVAKQRSNRTKMIVFICIMVALAILAVITCFL